MVEREIQVIVAGHICLDVIPEFRKMEKAEMKNIFVPGKLINMGSIRVSTGGPVLNTGIDLSIEDPDRQTSCFIFAPRIIG
jgi:hypothetical protein